MVLLRIRLKETLKAESLVFLKMELFIWLSSSGNKPLAQTGVMDDILPPTYHREHVLVFIPYLSLTRLEMHGRNVTL